MLMRDEEEIIFHTVRLPEAGRAAVVLGLHDDLFQCDIRLPYHHFERGEKSLSFAVMRTMAGNPKRENCYSALLRASP